MRSRSDVISDVISVFGLVALALLLAPVSARRGEQSTVVTEHFSGPGRAIGPMCEYVSVFGPLIQIYW